MRKGSMSTEELSSVQSFLKPLFYVKAVWKGSSGLADDMYHSIAGKVLESQRPRPDVVQIACAYSMRSKMEGVSYEACIDDWLRGYAERATHTKQISDWESKVIKILPLQTQSRQQKLAYHWHHFKIDESGLPYGQLSNDAWLYGTKPRDTTNALWVLIQAASPEKWQFCVHRYRCDPQGVAFCQAVADESKFQDSGWDLP